MAEWNGFTPLHYACFHVNGSMIRLLLSLPNSTVRQKDFSGRWPIHYILVSTDPELVDLLDAATFPEEENYLDDLVEVNPNVTRFRRRN